MSDRDADPIETTGVIICGGGPTGALLSALLGRMGVPNVVLERDEAISTDPRGIVLDEEGIRIIQSIGMYHRIHTSIAQCQELRCISGAQHDLMKPPFLSFDLTSSDGGTGHVGIAFQKQPDLERAIRDAICQSAVAELRSKSLLVSITEGTDSVQAEYVDRHGLARQIRAPFLVGADGKTGFVRKIYLEPRGLSMDPCPGTNYDETWVALNWQMRLPSPTSHPEFPLWKLGYTPEEAYDMFFPRDFRFLCNPSRTAVCGRFGPPAERLWRFEFVVHPGEDPNSMAVEEEACKIIFPYITHPGQKYGLSSPVSFPQDCITILRSRPFHFSARSCNKWALGRVILAGDAAHVMPPFGGQGIASGFRDAAALAWRLAYLIQEPRADYERVLRDWYVERKQQFERSLTITVRNGQKLTEVRPWRVFLRDWLLWILQLSPYIRYRLEREARAEGMTRYHQDSGLPFLAELGGGLNIPQVYARDLRTAKLMFTDDLIFSTQKDGMFQLLVLADRLAPAWEAWLQVAGLSKRTAGSVREDEATILLHTQHAEKIDVADMKVTVARVASAEEFAADPDLCQGRPVPRFYNSNRIREEVGRKIVYIILRPDRYVYAACSNTLELWNAVDTLTDALHIP